MSKWAVRRWLSCAAHFNVNQLQINIRFIWHYLEKATCCWAWNLLDWAFVSFFCKTQKSILLSSHTSQTQIIDVVVRTHLEVICVFWAQSTHSVITQHNEFCTNPGCCFILMENYLDQHCWSVKEESTPSPLLWHSKSAHYSLKLSEVNDFIYYLSSSSKPALMLWRHQHPNGTDRILTFTLFFLDQQSIMQSFLRPCRVIKYAKIPRYIIHNVICTFIHCLTSQMIRPSENRGGKILRMFSL